MNELVNCFEMITEKIAIENVIKQLFKLSCICV